MSQTWPVTLYAQTDQTWPVTLWDGSPPSEGYIWYDVDLDAHDTVRRAFLAPLDLTSVLAPLDLTNTLAPLDLTSVLAPLDRTDATAPLDMETEV